VGMEIPWGYPQDFLWVWDGYGDRNSVPTAALRCGHEVVPDDGDVLRAVCSLCHHHHHRQNGCRPQRPLY